MSSSRSKLSARITALAALFLFAGFLIADHALSVSNGHCSEMTSGHCDQDQETCHHCFCSFHGGAVLAFEPVRLSGPTLSKARDFPDRDQYALDGERLSIDQPPRFA